MFANCILDVPTEVGCFSVDSEKGICMNRSLMKFCVPLEYLNNSQDHSEGYDVDCESTEFSSADKMKHLLKWILLCGLPKECGVDFITLQETMQKILLIPYCLKPNKSWSIVATKFKGVIYVMEVGEKPEKASTSQKKFKQLMTAEVSEGIKSSAQNAQGLEDFSIVLTNKLENHTLLYAAVVDAAKRYDISEARTQSSFNYVDMYITSNDPTTGSKDWFKKYKSLKWWTKSRVAGIEEIMCGYRDENGSIATIESMKTSELPPATKDWTPEGCFDFLNYILTMLKNTVTLDGHRTVYKFEFLGENMIAREIINNVDGNGIRIIPDYFANCEPICHSLLQRNLESSCSYQSPELTSHGYPNYCGTQVPESYMHPVNQFTVPASMCAEQYVQRGNLQMPVGYIPPNRMGSFPAPHAIELPETRFVGINRPKRRSQKQKTGVRNCGSSVAIHYEEELNASLSVASGSNSRRSKRKQKIIQGKKYTRTTRNMQMGWKKRKQLILKLKKDRLKNGETRSLLDGDTNHNSRLSGSIQDKNIIPK